MVIKIYTDAGLENYIRSQLNYFNNHDLDRDCWIRIGDTTTQNIIYRNTGISNELENWINFIGFSRIDGCPIFNLPDGCLGNNGYILDIFRKKGLSLISQDGNHINLVLDIDMILSLVAVLEDHMYSGFNTFIKKGKQIFCEIDPYGEECWD